MNGPALDLAYDFLKHALNGGQAGLHLPAVKIGSVVRNLEAEPSHV
jgi:hypothetical protein